MGTLKLIAFDVRNGIVRYWWKYLAAAAFSFLFSLAFARQLVLMQGRMDLLVAPSTLGDCLTNLVVAIPRYVFETGFPFVFAGPWLLTLLLVAYLTLGYPCRDLGGPDRQLVMAAGSRWAWWLSKCVWVVLSVLAFFLAIGVGAALWTVVSGGSLGLHLSSGVAEMLGCVSDSGSSTLWQSAAWLYLAAVLVALALCLVQMLVSLFVKPILSFIVTIVLLFLWAECEGPSLTGALLAVLPRQPGDVAAQALVGAGVAFGVIALAVVVGGLCFKHTDIR